MILSYTNIRLLLVLKGAKNDKETAITRFNLQKYRGMQKKEAMQQEEGKVQYLRNIKAI